MPLRAEKEKMLAGENYNGLDSDLQAELQRANVPFSIIVRYILASMS